MNHIRNDSIHPQSFTLCQERRVFHWYHYVYSKIGVLSQSGKVIQPPHPVGNTGSHGNYNGSFDIWASFRIKQSRNWERTRCRDVCPTFPRTGWRVRKTSNSWIESNFSEGSVRLFSIRQNSVKVLMNWAKEIEQNRYFFD